MAATEEQKALAQQVREMLLAELESRKFKFTESTYGEDIVFKFTVIGKDLPIPLSVIIRPAQTLVSIISRLTFDIPVERRVEMAVAVAAVNYGFYEGTFDYSVPKGRIDFRLTSNFRGGSFSRELSGHLISRSIRIVDMYNDKLLALANGTINIQHFLEIVK